MEDFWLHTEYFYSSFHSSSLLSGAAQVSVGGVWGVRWWDFTVSRPRARRTSSGLRGCMWFDFCCSNELHGYRPDTNGCGLFKLSSLKSHANASGALNMWWAFFSCQRWVFFCFFFSFYTCLLGSVSGSLAGLLVLHLFLKMLMSLRLKITMQILLSGPSSGDQGLSYQHILHLWTYALLPAPPAKCSPPLLHRRLIFCVSELWIVVLPHCNKQMAARSWVITNPLREWLVLSRAALIRARWLSPVFAQALKSSSGFVTLGVCSG